MHIMILVQAGLLLQYLMSRIALCIGCAEKIKNTEGPTYMDFGTTLPEIPVSGTVGGCLLMRKSPTCMYISPKSR